MGQWTELNSKNENIARFNELSSKIDKINLGIENITNERLYLPNISKIVRNKIDELEKFFKIIVCHFI